MVSTMSARMISTEEVLTTPQVCGLLKITRQTLYTWMEQGRIKPWMKAGGASWLFIRDEIMQAKNSKYQRA